MSHSPEYLPSRRLFESDWRELSDLELLALWLAPGRSEEKAWEEAVELLRVLGSVRRLQDSCYPQLRRAGLSRKRILAMMACRELMRRCHQGVLLPGESFRSSLQIYRHFEPLVQDLARECFWTLLLDGKNRIRRLLRVSEGSLTSSLVHPREVFRPAILEAAAGVLFVHNHPSGDPSPSQEDVQVTQRLAETGRIVGIRVLDHVIIGAYRYFSFADRGML